MFSAAGHNEEDFYLNWLDSPGVPSVNMLKYGNFSYLGYGIISPL